MPDLRHLPLLLVLLSSAATASPQPIEKIGKACPLGFYSQASYCIPSRGYRQDAIPRYGTGCPLGWYSSGAYCTRAD